MATNQATLSKIASYLQPKYANYLLSGGGYSSVVDLPPNRRLTADEVRFLDLVRDSASGLRVDDLLPYMTDTTGDTIQEVRDFLAPISQEQQQPVYPPLSIQQIEAGAVQPGSVPIRTDIEPGELSRPETPATLPTRPRQDGQRFPTAADESALAFAEFGVPPTVREPYTAPEGYEWVYDTLQSKPVLVKIGEGGDRPVIVTDSGDGTGGVSDVAEEPADTNIPEDWRNAAREMYPQYYAIVRNIPEIAQLLEKAINESYTPEKFQAELEQTNWFQQTSGSAREWEINSQRDPASAQRKIDEQIVTIRDLALSSFGVRLSDERLSQLAEDSLRFGWSNRFLQNAIGDVATTSTTGISQLREGYIGQQLRKTADDYGISVSDATFNQWVNKVAVGQESTATFQDYARVQAKNLFPSISDRIDAGETFQQIIDPYRESAASLLEIDGGTIDFKQPDWIKAVTYQDEKGQQRPMSFTEWNDYVRQNRSFGYEYTEQAQRRAYQVANSLANLFGKV